MDGNLKECPFCGAEAVLWPFGIVGGRWKVSCSNDCITMPPRFDLGFTTKKEAITKWNTRIQAERLHGEDLCELFHPENKYNGEQVRKIILQWDQKSGR